jgi:hypothetical protein
MYFIYFFSKTNENEYTKMGKCLKIYIENV